MQRNRRRLGHASRHGTALPHQPGVFTAGGDDGFLGVLGRRKVLLTWDDADCRDLQDPGKEHLRGEQYKQSRAWCGSRAGMVAGLVGRGGWRGDGRAGGDRVAAAAGGSGRADRGLVGCCGQGGFHPAAGSGRALTDATCALAAGASCLSDIEAMTAQVEIFGPGGGASDTTMLRVLNELATGWAPMGCRAGSWPRRWPVRGRRRGRGSWPGTAAARGEGRRDRSDPPWPRLGSWCWGASSGAVRPAGRDADRG